MSLTDQQKTNMEQWLEALRSGKYQQARGVLHKPGVGHCCLGVLAEIQGIPGVPVKNDPDIRYTFPDGSSTFSSPPEGWLLDVVGVGFKDSDLHVMELNDTGVSFSEIADKLEEAYLR